MQPILVAYATTEGQTGKIAAFIAERLRIRGHRVDLVDTATPVATQVVPIYQAAFLGGSLHQQRHQESLRHFISSNRAWLSAMPTAFFSVSLAAALEDMDSRLETQRLLQEFLAECGVRPLVTRCIPGALKYTHYDYFKRLVMRYIAKEQGRPTDTSRDYEYTNWVDVEAFVDEFLAEARIPGGAHMA
jgi:menaquinone-dependent protoporphyrinogen oxidase